VAAVRGPLGEVEPHRVGENARKSGKSQNEGGGYAVMDDDCHAATGRTCSRPVISFVSMLT